MKAFFDPVTADHAPTFFLQRGFLRKNWEVPARAEALLAGCRSLGLEVSAPGPADVAAVRRVHAADYLAFLADGFAAWSALPDRADEMVANIHPTPEMIANGAAMPSAPVGRLGWFTADTACPITARTFEAAMAAASCALAAAGEVAAGRDAYALCRPPGHHAYPARAGGHCYLNNAAIAAEALRAAGAMRVAILDIDCHHGNGTQSVFWARDDIITVSVHGDPDTTYPWFVGRADERGIGAGCGCNLNLPLAKGSDDTTWLNAVDEALFAVRRAHVDALVLGLGFDAYAGEPLAVFGVTADGFARAGALTRALGIPTAIVQEGGYAVDALGGLLSAFLNGFGEAVTTR